jgi:hypothetical protein
MMHWTFISYKMCIKVHQQQENSFVNNFKTFWFETV